MVDNNGVNTFTFSAVNPQNVIGYEWDFGDNSPPSYLAAPTHTYSNSGNYLVTLRLSSSCGFTVDTVAAHIVGIPGLQPGSEELTVYPNPARDQAVILNKGSFKMESIRVYNVLGQLVLAAPADAPGKHTLRLEEAASGIYTIEVLTDKGTIVRKLELLR